MKKRGILLSLFMSLFFYMGLMTAYAQPSKVENVDRLGDSLILKDIMPKPERIPLEKSFKGSWALGLNLQTNGYGIVYQHQFIKDEEEYGSVYRNKFGNALTLYYYLSEVRHPKEISSFKFQSSSADYSSAYILGKVNRLYTNQLGLAYKKALGARLEESSIGIDWLTGGHINVGMLVPYYLRLSTLGEVTYDEEIENQFINPGMIQGRSDYFRGFKEMEVRMGLGIKTAISFNLASKTKQIIAIQAHGGIDYYFTPMHLMVRAKEQSWFYQFGVSLLFGKYY